MFHVQNKFVIVFLKEFSDVSLTLFKLKYPYRIHLEIICVTLSFKQGNILSFSFIDLFVRHYLTSNIPFMKNFSLRNPCIVKKGHGFRY